MSSLSPALSNAQIAANLLSAQADANSARADAARIDGRGGIEAGAFTQKYDVNQITKSEAGFQRVRLQDAVQRAEARREGQGLTTQSEASKRAVEQFEKRTQEMAKALSALGAPQLAKGQTILALFPNAGDEAISVNTSGSVSAVIAFGGNKLT